MNKAHKVTLITALLSIIILIGVNLQFVKNVFLNEPKVVFSNAEVLENTWYYYKKNYIESTGRTLDRQQADITTSEGQSYTMLSAVWIDDKDTFDKSWKWTKENLQRKEDNLFSWLYGKKSNGEWAILEERGGKNTATDGDTDIALALVMAANRWSNPEYLAEAKKIISSVWAVEVAKIGNRYVLLSNSLEKEAVKNEVIVNPSYFSPYAYKVFAKLNPENAWSQLATDTYSTLDEVTVLNLDKGKSSNLPPNWVILNKSDQSWKAAENTDLNTNFSYDALRVPWRIYLDWMWFKEEKALQYLSKLNFLDQEWTNNQAIYRNYTHDGIVVEKEESLAMYGSSIAYFMAKDKGLAEQIYKQKLEKAYNRDISNWETDLGYYNSNWAWFGTALYNGLTVNLAENIENNTKLKILTKLI